MLQHSGTGEEEVGNHAYAEPGGCSCHGSARSPNLCLMRVQCECAGRDILIRLILLGWTVPGGVADLTGRA